MRHRLTLFFWLLVVPFLSRAQILNPVHWDFHSESSGPHSYLAHFQAVIDPGWHIYAQNSGKGPVPTSFTFDLLQGLRLEGKVQERGTLIQHFDAAFDSKLRYYESEVDFVQNLRWAGSGTPILKGSLQFMVCNDRNCLPPKDIPFSIPLGAAGTNSSLVSGPSQLRGVSPASVPKATIKAGTAPQDGSDDASGKPLGWIFLACFAGGFLALITPCVFSMIPLTVSFFTKQGESRSKGIGYALTYSASIILIYTLFGFLVTRIFGPDALNYLASNIWVNLLFFFLFIAFALSFLGAFEINLPSSLANRANARSGLGSLAGIFFMALTLSLVSFSCTGPIIGNLIVLAYKGGSAGPLVGMFGFSLALAIPFTFFAIFPQWMNRMGKAGGWLNAVKVTLGFLELALALKFLSNVDMAYHWGILSKEVFLSLWIVIFSMMGFYLLGKIRLPHEEPLKTLSIPRLFFSLAAFSLVVYLLPGLFGGEPQGIISGFLPNYSNISFGFSAGNPPATSNTILPEKYVNLFSKATPKGYLAFYDYSEALHAARVEKKPLMIDFTGWSCVNCRKMENTVWTDPRVRETVGRDFILVSLYVDDRTALPDTAQYISRIDGSRIRTLGQRNADLEETLFDRNSQPYYVFLDQNARMLSSRGYAFDTNPDHFLKFLDSVKTEYSRRNP